MGYRNKGKLVMQTLIWDFQEWIWKLFCRTRLPRLLFAFPRLSIGRYRKAAVENPDIFINVLVSEIMEAVRKQPPSNFYLPDFG